MYSQSSDFDDILEGLKNPLKPSKKQKRGQEQIPQGKAKECHDWIPAEKEAGVGSQPQLDDPKADKYALESPIKERAYFEILRLGKKEADFSRRVERKRI